MDIEKSPIKTRTSLIALLVLMIVLCFIAIRQYKARKQLQQQNKQLILQNDSILSANIELKKQLSQSKQGYFSVRNQEKK
jgi:cell division protein FtsB